MGRSRKNKPFFENVEIIDIGAEGKAVARVNDLVVFIPQAIPGDVVNIQVVRKRKRYNEARIVNFIKYSEIRINPFCEHFGVCGGCKWQHLPYEKQLYYKQKQVTDQLQRIGKIELPEISPIVGAKNPTFYRNKLEFTFSNKRWFERAEFESGDIEQSDSLGFHVPGYFDKVVDIKKCWLQPDPSNQIRNAIREYALQNKLDFFDIKEQKGLLRNIIIRTSTTGEVMVIVSFFSDKKEKREALLDMLSNEFPQISSLIFVINQKGNDTILDQEIIVHKGTDHIFEQMEGLRFKIGPKSFYQTNSEQAYELYKIAREFAGLGGEEVVYDLYTGTGTIANFVACMAKKVVGIEYVPEAIEDARINSEINGIKNTLFFAGDMKAVLNEDFLNEHGHPDVIITDPPRAGMDAKVVETILNASPKRIVYVSCNPATQARDLELLNQKYTVTKVQPVDMFPHTHHVENVVLLEKK
ncbi:MAG: 23S rRNA (uracil(1939)-C(5))-methyltransferase RlmD [Prolixibacteraceae bacterium]|nr:23S rRNA (uracil(1939)-C(5))-methyltransferase RlmD [Prolixibacteraceae bacterium]